MFHLNLLNLMFLNFHYHLKSPMCLCYRLFLKNHPFLKNLKCHLMPMFLKNLKFLNCRFRLLSLKFLHFRLNL
jgi:hypothetical protein